MTILPLAAAKAHLHLQPDYPDEQVAPYLASAEDAVQQFLNRRVFADAGSLQSAVEALPVALTAAASAHADAVTVANLLEDAVAKAMALEHACATYAAAQARARETYAGIVVNGSVEAAIRLVLSHLFENREQNVVGAPVASLELGSFEFLWPYRVGLGV